jgi:hypothetical protein
MPRAADAAALVALAPRASPRAAASSGCPSDSNTRAAPPCCGAKNYHNSAVDVNPDCCNSGGNMNFDQRDYFEGLGLLPLRGRRRHWAPAAARRKRRLLARYYCTNRVTGAFKVGAHGGPGKITARWGASNSFGDVFKTTSDTACGTLLAPKPTTSGHVVVEMAGRPAERALYCPQAGDSDSKRTGNSSQRPRAPERACCCFSARASRVFAPIHAQPASLGAKRKEKQTLPRRADSAPASSAPLNERVRNALETPGPSTRSCRG